MARRPQPSGMLESHAVRLQEILRARGQYGHVTVRAARGHLLIEVNAAAALPDVDARATPLGAGTFGLSFRTHTGRWEPMPVVGPLDEVAAAVTDLLGPYIDPANLK